jgi:hypothetical protein
MSIPGIDDKDLQRQHWRDGDGRGALGYRHLPSGVSVYRECGPGVPLRVIDAELLAELEEQLRLQGLLPVHVAPKVEPT